MRVMLQGLRTDADECALADLLWDHTADSRTMAYLKVNRLRCGGTFLSTMTMPEELGWFLMCAREFGVESVLLLGGIIHE